MPTIHEKYYTESHIRSVNYEKPRHLKEKPSPSIQHLSPFIRGNQQPITMIIFKAKLRNYVPNVDIMWTIRVPTFGTYKFNIRLNLRAYSYYTHKLEEQTNMIKAKLIGSRRPYRRKITQDFTH